MDLAHIVSAVISVLGIFLLGMTWMYLDKLEKIGCACAEHPYRKFIKNYTVFAIVFLLLTMAFPPALAARTLGTSVAKVYALVSIPYYIATIVFFIMALVYVRYLMREKCKCSEDVRREILYVWAILEIVIISALFVIPIIGFLVNGSLAMASTALDKGNRSAASIRDAAVDPVASALKVGESVKKSLRKLRK
jgi:hypothetical protein